MTDKSPEYLAQSKAVGIYIAYALPIPIAIVSTSVRIWAEYRHHRTRLAYDDYLMLLTTTINVAYCIVAMVLGPQYGLGRHREVVSDEMLKMIMLGDYILSYMYHVGIVTTKLSVLALYHRAFPSVTFHRIILLTGTVVFMWLLSMEFVLAGICQPVRKFWDDAVQGTCIDICAFGQFNNSFNLIADVWIFVLPLPIISRLRISTRKKIGLGFVFSIGLATCGLSIARVTFVKTECGGNTPWKMPPLLIMSAWEPLGGILCANLPIMYKPVAKAFRRLTGMRPSEESADGRRTWYRYHFDKSIRQKRKVQLEVTTADNSYTNTVDIETVDSRGGLLDREIVQNGFTLERPK